MLMSVRSSLRKTALALAILLSGHFLTAETSELVVKFIKGNISDKTSVIRSAEYSEKAVLAEMGLDFLDDNAQILADDRDLSALGVASVFSLSKDSDRKDIILKKLVSVFRKCQDTNVRSVILDRLPDFSADEAEREMSRELVGWFLESEGEKPVVLVKNSFDALGKIGNQESLGLLFGKYVSEDELQHEQELGKALIALMNEYKEETLVLISETEISKISKIFDLVKNSSEITKNYQMDIVENALSLTLYNMENQEDFSEEGVALQLRLVEFIAGEDWSHATDLVAWNFSVAKKEYDAEALCEDDFIKTIRFTSALKSPKISSAFSECLAGFNKSVSNESRPSETVVLALIKSLGDLGDKTAFDNLLCVTYLDYSEEVVNAARLALASLKW